MLKILGWKPLLLGLITTVIIAIGLSIIKPAKDQHMAWYHWCSEKWTNLTWEEFDPNYPLEWGGGFSRGFGWREFSTRWNWITINGGSCRIMSCCSSPINDIVPEWAEYARPTNGNTLHFDQYREIGRYGWPFHALIGGHHLGQTGIHQFEGHYIGYWVERERRKGHWGLRRHFESGGFLIPLKPIFIGIGLDTLFYAWIWVGIMRRWSGLMHRRIVWIRQRLTRKGLCWKCRYDLRGNLHKRCPECGEPVSS